MGEKERGGGRERREINNGRELETKLGRQTYVSEGTS